MQNKEEHKGIITLNDFVRGNLPTQSNRSTIHRTTIRPKMNTSVRCTFKGGKKRSTIIFKNNEDLPILGSKYKKTQTSRMYESVILEDDQSRKSHKKVLLSDLTGMNNRPKSIQRQKSTKKQEYITRYPSYDHEPSKMRKLKGYQGKNARLRQEQHTMSMLFGNYQRFTETKLEKGLISKLRQEIIAKQANKFSLLRQL